MGPDLTHIPLTDHHCHTITGAQNAQDAERFLRSASEAPGTYPLADLQETVTYQALLDIVKESAGRRPETFGDLSVALASLDYDAHCRHLFTSRGYRRLLVDTGFAPPGGLDLESLARATAARTRPILRLETLAEALWHPTQSFDDWWEAFRARVADARRDGFVGAKSIAAYRCGLAVRPITRAQAADAFARWSERSRARRAQGLPPRLDEADLIFHVLWESAPVIAEQELPLQFHTGYGDPDEDLAQSNPLCLRPFLAAFTPRGLRVALLHTYPYHREAGYLASVCPGVYFDVSLIIPHGATSARRVVAEALELAPVSRFLFASDAHTRPEMFALAADLFRDALAHWCSQPEVARFAPPSTLERWCSMILHENADRLYGLHAD